MDGDWYVASDTPNFVDPFRPPSTRAQVGVTRAVRPPDKVQQNINNAFASMHLNQSTAGLPRKNSLPFNSSSALRESSLSGSTSASSDASTISAASQSRYTVRFGRKYHKDRTLPYPLPCDIIESHRQLLRHTLLTEVFGSPFCAPYLKDTPPKRVLEVACGTAIWTSDCHNYFSKLGYPDIEYVGLDLAPLSANLKEEGVNWIFVQHDVRNLPLPFTDEVFDYIFVRDLSLVVPAQVSGSNLQLMDEYLRILKRGGTLEMWECEFRPL
jgi:Methyltransferase domain